MNPTPKSQFLGEFVGTFLLVFFGCGSVAGAVVFDSFEGLFQIAAIWGLGLTVAITLTAPMSGAHLNPAITLAFALSGDMDKRRVPLFVLAQFLGAFAAAAVLYFLVREPLLAFEKAEGIRRGLPGSVASARIFGEYHATTLSGTSAFFAEFLGTALLAFVIFVLTDKRRPPAPSWFVPPAIGLTLTVLISIFAPISMAGFNPARDFAPRVFSSLAGWGGIPFSENGWSWLTVYIVAPCLGAVAGALAARRLPA